MSHRHQVDRWLMALTTKEASYIIVLGIVISVLPTSTTLLQDGYHIRFKQKHYTKEKRRQSNSVDLLKTNVPNQFTFRRHSRCHFRFRYDSRNHFRAYRGCFRVQFRSFPLQHTASRRQASAVALWSSRRASQQSVRSSSRSLRL